MAIALAGLRLEDPVVDRLVSHLCLPVVRPLIGVHIRQHLHKREINVTLRCVQFDGVTCASGLANTPLPSRCGSDDMQPRAAAAAPYMHLKALPTCLL